MAREKRVKFVLEANDMASATLKKIGREADTLQGKLSALAAAGKVRFSGASLQASMAGSGWQAQAARSGIASIPAGMYIPKQENAPSYDYGLASLVSSSARGVNWGSGAASAGTAALDSQIARMKDLGIAINESSSSISALEHGMQKVAQDRAFKHLASDAGLSHTQLAKLRMETGDTSGAMSSLWDGVKGSSLAIAAWAAALGMAGKAALDATVRMDRLDKAYTSIEGSSSLAQKQLDFIYETSNELGLQFQDTAESAKTFFASMKNTEIAGDANRIFVAVSKAATALSLSQENVQGVFYALGQMASKGKVMAEELRGQLGERLPGAFQMTAEAMGMTTAELDKAMELGQVTANEMLPKLADVLEKRFGPAAANAASGLQQGLNRVNTEWERFKASILDSEAVSSTLEHISGALKGYNDMVKQGKERAALIKEMEKEGIKKLGVEIVPNVDIASGTYSETSFAKYTEAQIEDYKKLKEKRDEDAASVKAAEDAKNQAYEEGRRIFTNNQRTVERYLQDSEESRRAAMQKERDAALKAVDEMIAIRQKEGKSYEDLLAQRTKVEEEYNRKSSSLDRKYKPEGKGSSSGVSSAISRIEEYRRQIETLRGESDSSSASLEKTLDAIGRTGVKAKMSAPEIAALKAEFADAWSTKELDEFNRTLLEAQGNTAKLKDMEIAKAVDEWKTRLESAGLSAEEASKKALMLGEALRNQETVQSLETVNSVLKELEEKTGQYGLSIDTTNKLIEKQVQIWRQAGVPEEYIEQLREIRRLESSRDAWDGMLLGTREYFSSASNMAEGFKSTVTQAFGNMEDAITEACMTGKVSFSDMINSMIKDLIRLMVRQSVTAPIANGIMGFFGGGGSTAATANASSFNFASAGGVGASQALSFIPGVAHTGGMAESLSRYSGPVPASLFAYAPRFHAGSGYIRPGEYPAILKRGERVLNPAETRAYQQGQQVNVNIVNSTGQNAQARTRTDNFGNKTIDVYVGDMAAKQMATPGSTLNRAVSAQTGTSRPAIRR